MESHYTVGDLVAEFLAAIGVETAVGIVSVHNTPMLDAIGRRNAIRFVMARGEMGAAHIADGYARVTGRLGVLFSSTGPGAANAVGGLFEARFASTPLLHLTGLTATGLADRRTGAVHDPYDQLAMLQSVSKGAFRIRSAESALGMLIHAATLALTPPMGPVSVEIPIDIQKTPVRRPDHLDHLALPVPAPLRPSESVLDELVARVRRARQPMLWLGSGARHAGEAAERLLGMGFGMATSHQGRGSVSEDHPLNLGGFNGAGLPAVQDLYRKSDLLLVAGSRLRAQETADFRVPLPANLIQVDVDPTASGRTYPNRFFVCGDSAVVLDELAGRLDGAMHIDPAFTADIRATKARVRDEFAETLGPYSSFAGELRNALPADGIWARDVTMSNTTWGHRLFPLYDPRANVYPVGAGIGQGMPLAIGAALGANGRKVLAMTGDGGFFLNIGEFWTAVQERLDMVLIVMNDRGYGAIRQIQNAIHERRNFYVDLAGPDIGGFAALARVPFWLVRDAASLGKAVGEALATPGPTIVEVDMEAIGPIPPYDYSSVASAAAP